VPEVLLTGHHANIEAWRRQQSIIRTYERRPDLLEHADLTEEEREFLTRLIFQKNFDVY
jgi:tRNA (guanine37-N1)-methyltransferase